MNGQKYLTENDVFAAAPDAASNFWEMHHSRFFKSIFNLEKKLLLVLSSDPHRV